MNKFTGQVDALKSSFVWNVENFSELDGELQSKPFSVGMNAPTMLCLVLYPNGEPKKFKNYVSLFAQPVFNTFEGQFKFSILDSKLKKINEVVYSDVIQLPGGKVKWGSSRFINRNIIFNPIYELLSNNILRIHCEVVINSLKLCPGFPLQQKLHSDLSNILEHSIFSDFILEVEDKEFKVHKNILAARSPIFRKLFNEIIKPHQSHMVTGIAHNIISQYRHLLHIIYTEKVNIRSDEAFELLIAAKMYELDDLKFHCQQELNDNLNIGNVNSYLILAHDNDFKWLKKKAISFFIDHAREIIDTSMYKNMIKSHPELLEEIYSETIMRQVQI